MIVEIEQMELLSLYSKLSLRERQYRIAIEGLNTIKESNDPMEIAERTLDAMLDCLPK